MPNGKGQLDCCYCVHFKSEFDGSNAMYEEGFCNFHKAEIPSLLPTWNHRICKDFQANKHFDFYLQFSSLDKKIEEFGKNLEDDILYEFPSNVPCKIRKLKDL